jgi:hypothetical protein
MAYLRHYYEPDNINEQMRMQQRAKAYQIVSYIINEPSSLNVGACIFLWPVLFSSQGTPVRA